jgi:hypothetical protein
MIITYHNNHKRQKSQAKDLTFSIANKVSRGIQAGSSSAN